MVTVGAAGIHGSLLAELAEALEAHELLKVRVNAADRLERRRLIERLCAAVGAELVQTIGHVAVLYRRRRRR